MRDRLDRGRQPKHGPIFLQRLDILRAKYGPTAGIDYKLVTAGEFPADIGLQIAKVVPTLLGDDLRNRTLRTLDNLRIGLHELSSQSRRKQPAHRTLAGPPVANQHDIHEKRDSRTARMTSAGAA